MKRRRTPDQVSCPLPHWQADHILIGLSEFRPEALPQEFARGHLAVQIAAHTFEQLALQFFAAVSLRWCA
ncbi:protein of unknown function (plasmid) [Aminobacter niigataensis]|nr:protein of unknown function [Aminobacter niigataensis]